MPPSHGIRKQERAYLGFTRHLCSGHTMCPGVVLVPCTHGITHAALARYECTILSVAHSDAIPRLSLACASWRTSVPSASDLRVLFQRPLFPSYYGFPVRRSVLTSYDAQSIYLVHSAPWSCVCLLQPLIFVEPLTSSDDPLKFIPSVSDGLVAVSCRSVLFFFA